MKDHELQSLERAEKLADQLEKNPILRKMREDEAAENLSKRQAAAARIADLRLDLEATRILQTEIDSAVLNLAELDKQRAELADEIGRKRYFRATERGGIEAAIQHEEAALLDCYDRRIDEAITFFREHREFLLKKSIVEQERHGKPDIFTESKEVTVFSNYESIRRALTYCLAAIAALETMKLAPSPDLDRIEALRREIPDTDELREYNGEKATSRDDPPGPGLLSALRRASDSYTDAVVDSVLEKAKKILAPKRKAPKVAPTNTTTKQAVSRHGQRLSNNAYRGQLAATPDQAAFQAGYLGGAELARRIDGGEGSGPGGIACGLFRGEGMGGRFPV
jgi:hypothetical protein